MYSLRSHSQRQRLAEIFKKHFKELPDEACGASEESLMFFWRDLAPETTLSEIMVLLHPEVLREKLKGVPFQKIKTLKVRDLIGSHDAWESLDKTLLHFCLSEQINQGVSVLMEHGADPLMFSHGATPLGGAAYRDNADAFHAMIQYEFDTRLLLPIEHIPDSKDPYQLRDSTLLHRLVSRPVNLAYFTETLVYVWGEENPLPRDFYGRSPLDLMGHQFEMLARLGGRGGYVDESLNSLGLAMEILKRHEARLEKIELEKQIHPPSNLETAKNKIKL